MISNEMIDKRLEELQKEFSQLGSQREQLTKQLEQVTHSMVTIEGAYNELVKLKNENNVQDPDKVDDNQ